MARPDGKGRWLIGNTDEVTIKRSELDDLRALVAGYRLRVAELEGANAELVALLDSATEPPAAESAPEPAPPPDPVPSPARAPAHTAIAASVNGMLGTLRSTGAMAAAPQVGDTSGA